MIPRQAARRSAASLCFPPLPPSVGFLFGDDSGVINGTVDALRLALDSDAIGTGFNVASMLLGYAIGAFFAGVPADRLGP